MVYPECKSMCGNLHIDLYSSWAQIPFSRQSLSSCSLGPVVRINMSPLLLIFIMASALYSFMYVRPPSHSSIRSHGNYTALNQMAINHRGNKNSKNGALSRLTPDQTEKMKIEEIEEGRKKVIIPPPSIYRCCLGNLKHLGQFVRHRPDRHKGSICLTSIGPGTIVKPVPVRYEQSCFAGFLCAIYSPTKCESIHKRYGNPFQGN